MRAPGNPIKGYSHMPVLCDEAIFYLNVKKGGRYVDGTFGMGGYASRILEAANCELFAIDRDPAVIPTALSLSQKYGKKFVPLQGCFGNMDKLLFKHGIQ